MTQDFDDAVRRILDDEAARVDIAPDALGAIRARISARRSWRRLFPARAHRSRTRGGLMLTLSSAAATAVVVALVGVGSCAPHTTTHGAPAGGPTTSAPAGTGTPGPVTPGPPIANVPIYYLGAVGGLPKLYREYHPIPVGDGSTAGKVRAAINQMLDGRTAYDPDYSSQWPAGASLRNVTVAGGVATVDLAGATVNGYDPAGNKAALQQLIWTATAYAGGTGVKLLFNGKPRATLWASHLPVAGVLHRAAAVDTLAPVWVIDPQQGATTGTQVTVHLAGIVFEGTIQLRVRDAHGAVVNQQTVQLTRGAPAQGTATVHLQLATGKYTIEAYDLCSKCVDVQPIALDGHNFTVQ